MDKTDSLRALGAPIEKPEERPIVVSSEMVDLAISSMGASERNGSVLLPKDVLRKKMAELIRAQTAERVLKEALLTARALAGEDSLTHLPNPRALAAVLHREVARKRRFPSGPNFSVIMLDLDGFKLVNDTHGHLAGDAVLVEVAARINQRLRQDDFAARYGGDELTVIGQESNGGSIVFADDIRKRISEEPVCWRERRLSVGVSLGIVDFKPGTATDVDPVHLIEMADEEILLDKERRKILSEEWNQEAGDIADQFNFSVNIFVH